MGLYEQLLKEQGKEEPRRGIARVGTYGHGGHLNEVRLTFARVQSGSPYTADEPRGENQDTLARAHQTITVTGTDLAPQAPAH